MTHTLLFKSCAQRLRQGGGSLAVLLALTAMALAPQTATAQVVFEDFNDGNVDNVAVFFGGADGIGAGVGPGAGTTGEMTGLSIGVNPGGGGGFAGAAVVLDDGVDASSSEFLTFFVATAGIAEANLPLVLEVNLQEDADGNGVYDGMSEDEYQANYVLDAGSEYQIVQIPLASFTDDNSVNAGSDDGFDFSEVINVVFAIGNIPAGPEFTLLLDDLIFYEEAQVLPGASIVFEDFNDGNVDNVAVFFGGADGIGAGVGPGAGTTGEMTGLSIGVNPGGGGGFAGAAVVLDDGVDASSSEFLTFFVATAGIAEANLPLVLEVNLQEDADGNGVYDGMSEDEYQANYVLDAGSEYQIVQIPLASFTDDNSVNAGSDDGFDFSEVINVVFAIGNIPAGPEFTLLLDDISFASAITVANEAGALPNRNVVSAAYPNPFVSQARFDVILDRAEVVRVEVFDLLGRRIALLHEGQLSAQTQHDFELNGRDWVSGVYLYRVTGETFVETRRVILAK